MTAWPMADQWLGRSHECTPGSDQTMHPMHARIYHGAPLVGDVLVTPTPEGLAVGALLVVINEGAVDWEVQRPDTSTIGTVPAGQVAEVTFLGASTPVEGGSLVGSWRLELRTVGGGE